MKKKIIIAAIGGSLIAAMLFFLSGRAGPTDERCKAENFYWKGDFHSSSKGSFGFGKEGGESPLQTTSDYSGELVVIKNGQNFSFHWNQPEYQITLGLAGAKISSKEKNSIYKFLSQPWGVEGQSLKVALELRELTMDEKLVALNLLRKISQPFLNPNWKVEYFKSHIDTAENSVITMTDYQFSPKVGCQLDEIRIYEQSGGNYRKPWATTDTKYSRKWTWFGSSITLKDPINMPLQMNNGYENEKAARQDVTKAELDTAMAEIEKHASLLRQALRLSMISYAAFETALKVHKINEPDYRAGIRVLVDVGTDDALKIILNELKRNQANRTGVEQILLSLLSLKNMNWGLYQFVTDFAKTAKANKNAQLIACHFAGLYASRYPNSPERLDYLKSFLELKPENLPCLGNAGIPEAEPIIQSLMSSSNEDLKRQALLSLRFIRTSTSLNQLMMAMSQDQFTDVAREALRDRVERGIFEADLWKALVFEVAAKSKHAEFSLQLAPSFIMNYPGAFRESKQEPQSRSFWK